MLGRLVLAMAVVLLAACGQEPDEGPAASRSTATPSGPTSTAPTSKPSAGSTSLTGVVGEADESGCLTLTTTDASRTTWLLVGSTAEVTPGADVTVRGSPAPDLATRCQQGTPFVVEIVEPG